MNTLMLSYMREVIDEHSIPLEDPDTVMIEADWLVDMMLKVQEAYKNDDKL